MKLSKRETKSTIAHIDSMDLRLLQELLKSFIMVPKESMARKLSVKDVVEIIILNIVGLTKIFMVIGLEIESAYTVKVEDIMPLIVRLV